MKYFFNQIERVFIFFEKSKITFWSFLIIFLFLTTTAYFMENILLLNFNNKAINQVLAEILQPYHLITFLIIVLWIHFLTEEKIKKISQVILWGYLLIIFRPLIDWIFLKKTTYLTHYFFNSPLEIGYKFLTFFNFNQWEGVLFSREIETIAILLISFFYIFQKRKNLFLALVGLCGVYIIFFIGVAWPSLLVFLEESLRGHNIWLVSGNQIREFFFSPLHYFNFNEVQGEMGLLKRSNLIYNVVLILTLIIFQGAVSKNKLLALLKNVRYPQIVFNMGLFFFGFMFAFHYFPENGKITFFSGLVLINITLSILSVWLFSVFNNDLNDIKIDKISNKQRPLIKKIFTIKEYKTYQWSFLLLAFLLSLTVGNKFFLLTLSYVLLVTVYSQPPFRLKRFIGLASPVSAIASLLFFVMGYILVAPQQSLEFFPVKLVGLLFIVFILIFPLKDLKDIKGDRKNKIKTLPVWLGEKRTRQFIGVVLLVGYLISAWVLSMPVLFWWSIFFGISGYLIVNQKRIKKDKLLWAVLGEAIVYGGIILLFQ